MKKLMNKNRIIAILSVFMVLVFAVALLAQVRWEKVFAAIEYARDYTELSDDELDDLSFRKMKSDEDPQITVFMHGLGGRAFHWSNDKDGNFAYEAESMPEQLKMRIGEEKAEILVVKPGYDLFDKVGASKNDSSHTKANALSDPIDASKDNINNDVGAESLRVLYKDFQSDDGSRAIKIFDCNEKDDSGKIKYPNLSNGESRNALSIQDVSKHIIVIFDQWERYRRESHDFVYSQFEYCLDALSYQYAQLTGELPTFNLIGHSRGGVTIMQYALAHPYNVASIYSMGSPYNGSKLGSYRYGNGYPALDLVKMTPTYTYYDITDYEPGVLDIVENQEVTDSYQNYWNNHYDDFYSHIKFRPIGSYVTTGFLISCLKEYLNIDKSLSTVDELKFDTLVSVICNNVFFFSNIINLIISLMDNFEMFHPMTRVAISRLLTVISDETQMFKAKGKHIGKDSTELFVIGDDLFIDLDSQVAIGYKGSDYVLKRFEKGDNLKGLKSENNIGIAHNLETHNQDIINYIITNIETGEGTGAYDVRYTAEGCSIINLRATSTTGVLEIPKTYNGKTVVGVDGLTMNLDLTEKDNYFTGITKIIIPDTVSAIGDYAFYGMSGLQEVVIQGNGLINIGEQAFANCSSLKNVMIGEKVESLGEAAFIGCVNLATIGLAGTNKAYSSAEGIIYSKDGTSLIVYPEGKTNTSFTLPSKVTTIAIKAFYGNQTLTSVNLNNVTILSEGAFKDCANLSNITAPKLKYSEAGAFENTAWMNENSDDFVSLGSVLFKYQGNAEILHLSDYQSICELAFVNNTSLRKIYLDGTNLENIGALAFNGCSELKEVYIRNPERVVGMNGLSFDGTSANFKIYVPTNRLDEYKTNVTWKAYADKFDDLRITINFVVDGASQSYNKTVTYGEAFTNMPVPQKAGYKFIGWYTNQNGAGQLYRDGVINANTSDFTLYAIWEKTPYSIIYNLNGGTNQNNPTSYTVEDTIILNAPIREGYTFTGWELNGKILPNNQISSGTTGNLNLKAVWKANEIAVGFDSKGTAAYPASKIGRDSVLYGQTDYIFQVPERNGFKFEGWYYNGIPYTDIDGKAVRSWDLNTSTVLYAVWEAESFKIKYDTTTGSIYFSGAGWTEQDVEVTVGMQLASANILEETFQNYYKIQNKIIKYFYYLKPDGTQVVFHLDSNLMPFLESVNGTVEFYANFEQEVHTMYFITGVADLLFNAIVAESGSNIQSQLADRIPTRYGYTFGGWRVTSASGNSVLISQIIGYTMPDCTQNQAHGSCMVTAVWTPKTLTIELDSKGGTSVSSFQAIYDEHYILPIPTKLGYKFVGWYNARGDKYTDETGHSLNSLHEENLKLQAHWVAIAYQVTYNLNGGINSSYNPSTVYITGSYSLYEASKTGYRFMGWYRDGNYQTRVTVIQAPTGNMTLYAKWAMIFTIKLQNGSSISTRSGISGEVITLPSYSKVGYDGKYRESSTNTVYYFGNNYTIVANRTLNVEWTSNDLIGTKLIRTYESTIKDIGDMKNPYDNISLYDLTGYSVSELRNKGYKKVTLTIQLTVKEIDDGYQYIAFYDGAATDAKEFGYLKFEHGSGKKDTSYWVHTFTFTINLSEMSGNYICIRYNAAGNFADDWVCKNLYFGYNITQIA